MDLLIHSFYVGLMVYLSNIAGSFFSQFSCLSFILLIINSQFRGLNQQQLNPLPSYTCEKDWVNHGPFQGARRAIYTCAYRKTPRARDFEVLYVPTHEQFPGHHSPKTKLQKFCRAIPRFRAARPP